MDKINQIEVILSLIGFSVSIVAILGGLVASRLISIIDERRTREIEIKRLEEILEGKRIQLNELDTTYYNNQYIYFFFRSDDNIKNQFLNYSDLDSYYKAKKEKDFSIEDLRDGWDFIEKLEKEFGFRTLYQKLIKYSNKYIKATRNSPSESIYYQNKKDTLKNDLGKKLKSQEFRESVYQFAEDNKYYLQLVDETFDQLDKAIEYSNKEYFFPDINLYPSSDELVFKNFSNGQERIEELTEQLESEISQSELNLQTNKKALESLNEIPDARSGLWIFGIFSLINIIYPLSLVFIDTIFNKPVSICYYILVYIFFLIGLAVVFFYFARSLRS